MSKELIKGAISKFPALAAMYGVLSKTDQDKLAAEIGSIYKDSNPTGTVIKEEKPRTQLIIYYPDNFWTNKIHLKVNESFVGVYLLRDDVDFEKQVRNAGTLRGIQITSLEYTESKKLITTINNESPIDIKISEPDNPVDKTESNNQSLSTGNVEGNVEIDKQRNNSGTGSEQTGDLFG